MTKNLFRRNSEWAIFLTLNSQMQIKTRVTLWYTLLTALLLLGSLLFIYYIFKKYNENEFYRNLQSRAVMAVFMFEKTNPDLKIKSGFSNQSNLLPKGENFIVYTLKGEKLFSLHPLSNIPSDILKKALNEKDFRFQWNDFNYIATRYITKSGKELIVIAMGQCESAELRWLSRILLLTFFIFILIVSLIGYYFAGKVLSPIRKTMNEMDRITPTDLSKRLKISENKDEIQRLSSTFNQLLDRIEEAFRIQKGFLSNISHEVRNPISSMIAAIQLSLSKERTPEEYKHTLRLALHDAQELQNISFQLMELARLSDSSNQPKLQAVRIDEIVWQAKSAVRKVHSDFYFVFDDSSFPGEEKVLTILGNEALLKVALINLFENACKFSPNHTAHLSIFSSHDNRVCIRITDTAETITEPEKLRIFTPFFRSANATNVQGSGIGLSLVQSILQLHNVTLTIEPNHSKGNIFTVFFHHL